MTTEFVDVKRPAPLKNVSRFNELLKRVVGRAPGLPGMACFYGRSGLGKTKSAIYGANTSRATYVEVGQYTTAKSLLRSILLELGVAAPRGSVPELVEQAIFRLSADPRRPLIVDEAHHIAKPDPAALKTEQGGPSGTGVRQPYSGMHPAQGLTPPRLARLLRDSIAGDATAYLELAEDMEERDPHYAGVLGIRKRQVSGIPITVEAASDAPDDVAAADIIREIVGRDLFRFELIDILDAVGKGYSATEILWDTSEGQWRPKALKWRPPGWFRFDPEDGETLYLCGDGGVLEPLKPFSWIVHHGKAKSGMPIRGGLARLAAWSFMFKAFTLKDWAVFSEAFGQPIRLGKYQDGETEENKAKLMRAVADIGSDYAAIIAKSMEIDFVEASISSSIDLYERRANWLDQQVSKGVLGQTQTTDATAGGYATASVHDEVRADIEESDAELLVATLNRDLFRPAIDLNMGRRKVYPTVIMRRPDPEDVGKLVENVVKLVPMGLRVAESVMRDKLRLPDPAADEALLTAPTPASSPSIGEPPADPAAASAASALADLFARGRATDGRSGAIRDGVDLLTEATDALAGEAMDAMIGRVKDLVGAAASLDEVRDGLLGLRPEMPVADLAAVMRQALLVAELSGRSEIVDPAQREPGDG